MNSEDFKIGDIVIPIWRGSSPREVIGFDGVFLLTVAEKSEEVFYMFQSEVKISKELTREKKFKELEI